MRCAWMALLLLALDWDGLASAQERKFSADMNFEELIDDLVICSVYFDIVHDALTQTPGTDDEIISSYDNISSDFLQYALVTAMTTGREEDLAIKVIRSKFAVFESGMLEEIQYRNENLSILTAEHSQPCIDLNNNIREIGN
ncbi:MAG: hypothetical protein KDF64_20070 [Geminicoccaceae bacterium]|nr:hypothetical protein [Geminicoccaceae bacterium]